MKLIARRLVATAAIATLAFGAASGAAVASDHSGAREKERVAATSHREKERVAHSTARKEKERVADSTARKEKERVDSPREGEGAHRSAAARREKERVAASSARKEKERVASSPPGEGAREGVTSPNRRYRGPSTTPGCVFSREAQAGVCAFRRVPQPRSSAPSAAVTGASTGTVSG